MAENNDIDEFEDIDSVLEESEDIDSELGEVTEITVTYTGSENDDTITSIDPTTHAISVTIKPTWVNSASDLPEVGSVNVIYGIRNDSKFAVWDSANSEYAFFGYVLTDTEKTKLGTLIEMLDNDQFRNVDDVQVDNNSVVDANKIAQFLTMNGNYNASTNKLATESDLNTLEDDLKDYVDENGGKIDSISTPQGELTIDANKNVTIPYADNGPDEGGTAGLVKLQGTHYSGIAVNPTTKNMSIAETINSDTFWNNRKSYHFAVKGNNLDKYLKLALGSTSSESDNTTTWTETNKSNARDKLGVTDVLNGKVDKVTSTSNLKRFYSVNPDGTQSVTEGSEYGTPLAGRVVIAGSNGNISVNPTPSLYNDAASKRYVDTTVSNAIANVYKVQGSETVSNLNSATKTESMNGYVYNTSTGGDLINEDSSTLTIVAGDNVVFVWADGSWYWDKLSSDIDLTGYVQKTTTIAGVDLQDDITQSEMQTALDVVTKSDAQTITGAKTFSSEVLANNGIRTNNLNGLSGSTNIQIGKNLLPGVNNYVDLGATNRQWKDLYLAGNLTDGTNSVSVADAINKIESISAGGTALTPDANKNVNIPYADNGVPGVVKLGDNASGFINNQFVGLMLREPSLSNLQAPRGGASTQQTILLQNIATAVKYALCGSDRIGYYNNTENTGTETTSRSTPMTDAEKELAQSVLGIQYGLMRWDE